MKGTEEIKKFVKENKHKFVSPMAYDGDEINSDFEKEWDTAKLKVCVVASSTYRNLSGNLATPLLYKMINKVPGCVANRAFLPARADLEFFRRNEVPLFGIEHKKPLSEFDVLAFSTSAVGAELNTIRIMQMSGIPLESSERDSSYPLIVRGGQAVWNPEPVAPAFDFCFLGEAEATFPDILKRILAWVESGKVESKEDLLMDLAQKWNGVYVPSFYEPQYQDIGEYEIINEPKLVTFPDKFESIDIPEIHGHRNKCTTPILTGWKVKEGAPVKVKKAHEYDAVEGHSLVLDHIVHYENAGMSSSAVLVSRGCYAACRFCQEGSTVKPYRELPLDLGIDAIKKSMKETGTRAPLLSAFCSSSYSHRKEMTTRFLQEVDSEISFISQRVDEMQDPDFVSMTTMGKNKSVSLGVEGVNQRLRDVVSKNCTEEQLLTAIRNCVNAHYQKVKLFMMSNLPFEQQIDYYEGLDLVEKISNLKRELLSEVLHDQEFDYEEESRREIEDIVGQKELRKHMKRGFVIMYSFSPFFVTPHTPFQFAHPNIEKRALRNFLAGFKEEDLEPLREAAKARGINLVPRKGLSDNPFIKFRIGSGSKYGEAYLSQMLHLADRRIWPLIKSLILDHNFSHYHGTNKKTKELIDQMLRERGLSYDYYFREKVYEDVLPWDFIDLGLSKKWQWKEYLKAKDAVSANKCIDKCDGCGVCTPVQRKNFVRYKEQWIEDSKLKSSDIVKKTDKGKSVRLILSYEVDEDHRFMDRDYLSHIFRRVCYQYNWLVVKTISISSQSIRLHNYFAGKQYADISFTHPRPNLGTVEEIVKKFNDKMCSKVLVTSVRFYPVDAPSLVSSAEYCFYKIKSPKSLEETKEKIALLLSLPPVEKDILDFLNTFSKKRCDKEQEKERRIKKEEIYAATPQLIKTMEQTFSGPAMFYRDITPSIIDAWAVKHGDEVVIYTIMKGIRHAYNLIQGLFRLSLKASFALIPYRIDYVNYSPESLIQDDLFSDACDCVTCGRPVTKSIFDESLGDSKLCLRCLSESGVL